jgi:hypothetical protein
VLSKWRLNRPGFRDERTERAAQNDNIGGLVGQHGTARMRLSLNHPNATAEEVIGKVVHLRQHYHFGPPEISMYLKRATRNSNPAAAQLTAPQTA